MHTSVLNSKGVWIARQFGTTGEISKQLCCLEHLSAIAGNPSTRSHMYVLNPQNVLLPVRIPTQPCRPYNPAEWVDKLHIITTLRIGEGPADRQSYDWFSYEGDSFSNVCVRVSALRLQAGISPSVHPQ
ncbi:hypothetical protein TCAL_13338 [Tigriopus californicus]|uniref:Uncharacterized protein n=1 Tax=Tigriopus californicus TaxID=6832 RepID=A0A553PAP5_TIGCA|nr:hypothetical protein TCAL_13338 [Tigriopus californicus]|eukprot:TCALIF_13338-PA protein Name:"Protein of unknown function" AED:0.06 eAED:0.17 QI:0/0/0.5/1/0/0.5/2/868/128